jgi:hypothetical protein
MFLFCCAIDKPWWLQLTCPPDHARRMIRDWPERRTRDEAVEVFEKRQIIGMLNEA